MTDPEKPKKDIGTFRTILPQILASTAKNLLLLDLGMAVSFPTIVIPALKGLKAHDNSDFLTFTDTQASWFGKEVPISIDESTRQSTFLQQVSPSSSSQSARCYLELCSSHSGEKGR